MSEPRAVPAFIDNLAVVYNKEIFDKAGVEYPSDDWTWDDFVKTAAELNDPDAGIAGFGWPGTGDEDTTWRIWPLVWQQGGEIVNEEGDGVGFDGPSGEKALDVVADAVADDSVYIDSTAGSERMQQLFASGKMAMNIAGPYTLPEYVDANVDYGVAPMPSFGGEHTTIAGPDTWAIFDNGEERSAAAIEFMKWFSEPEQQLRWISEAGSLPVTNDVEEANGFDSTSGACPASRSSSRTPSWRGPGRRFPSTRRSPRRWARRSHLCCTARPTRVRRSPRPSTPRTKSCRCRAREQAVR